MKPLNILFFSLLYFSMYFAISLGIDLYFGLETSFPALTMIGFVFTIFLIVLLVFDVPEKIADKFSRKQERVLFYITEDAKDDKDTKKLLEALEENATKIEITEKKPEEKIAEKIVEPEIIKQDSEENVY